MEGAHVWSIKCMYYRYTYDIIIMYSHVLAFCPWKLFCNEVREQWTRKDHPSLRKKETKINSQTQAIELI